MNPFFNLKGKKLAIAYIFFQFVAFFSFIFFGRLFAPSLGAGAMDWIVTGAYGQVMVIALLVTLIKRDWLTHTCVQALAFVYMSNVVVSYYDPGFVAQGPWLLFWPLVWSCLVQKYRLALLIVPAIGSATLLYVVFGVRIDPGEQSYWLEVLNNFLHQLPLLFAGASTLSRVKHVKPGKAKSTRYKRWQIDRAA